MSGGHFQYRQYQIREIAEEIEEMITSNDSTEKNSWGEDIGYHYPPEIVARFTEAATTLRKAAAMAQRVDWLVSGDDGPESFMRRWDEEVPKGEAPCTYCVSSKRGPAKVVNGYLEFEDGSGAGLCESELWMAGYRAGLTAAKREVAELSESGKLTYANFSQTISSKAGRV